MASQAAGGAVVGVTPQAGDRESELLGLARAAKGFMPDDEGMALYRAALRAGSSGPSDRNGATFVEIGAWCGKSTIYIGAAAEQTSALLFSVDHHHGSEENQPGWEHHDREVVDPGTGRIDTLRFWRSAVDGAALGANVVGMVGGSPEIASRWNTPLDLCFIDGGHGEEPAWADFTGWSPHVALGGRLAIHDVFPDPAEGGRPPYELWCAALSSGEFVEDGECGSLRVLRRVEEAR
ncbi:MAG: class I SAM-dependent methyltransferase, partial [Acidimicrobiales bacterium]